MDAVVEGAGVPIAYRERGSGPPVLLVHGIADDRRAWEAAQDELAPVARAIAYDRRGYGASGAPEPYERTTVNEQAEDAAALLRALDAVPALVCAADLGALVALDLLLRHRDLVTGAVLVDPAAYALVPGVTEALSAERVELEEAVRDRGPAAAVDAYLAPRRPDAARLERARTTPLAMFADYAALATLPLMRRQLRRIDAPVVVLDGPSALPHERAAADALAAALSHARRVAAGDPVDAVRELLAAGSGQSSS